MPKIIEKKVMSLDEKVMMLVVIIGTIFLTTDVFSGPDTRMAVNKETGDCICLVTNIGDEGKFTRPCPPKEEWAEYKQFSVHPKSTPADLARRVASR